MLPSAQSYVTAGFGLFCPVPLHSSSSAVAQGAVFCSLVWCCFLLCLSIRQWCVLHSFTVVCVCGLCATFLLGYCFYLLSYEGCCSKLNIIWKYILMKAALKLNILVQVTTICSTKDNYLRWSTAIMIGIADRSKFAYIVG